MSPRLICLPFVCLYLLTHRDDDVPVASRSSRYLDGLDEIMVLRGIQVSSVDMGRARTVGGVGLAVILAVILDRA